MIITIIISGQPTKEQTRRILDNIAACSYPVGKIEVVFLIEDGSGVREFPGAPLVKVRSGSLNDAIAKALGDLIVFADINTRFPPGKLTAAVQCFMQKADLGVFSEGFFVVPKEGGQLPVDLFCLKTNVMLTALTKGRVIIGRWGRLNRREALRFAYKMDRVRLRDKLKILWGCR